MALIRELGGAAALFAALVMIPACAGTDAAPTPGQLVPEIVAATPPKTMPGGMVAVQYWMEGDPKSGKMSLFKIYPGNKIYRNQELLSAVNYQYNNTATENSVCTPGVDCPADTIHMFTDQTKVSYVEGGQCFHNGATDTIAACQAQGVITTTACAQEKVFCGPIQIASNYLFGGTQGAMPDPILDIGNDLVASPPNVLGCMNDSGDGNKHGLCATQAPAKIDPATSNFVPAIPASGSLEQCSYCYGNNSRAGSGLKGLIHALRSGTGASLLNINTDTAALQLATGDGFSVTITLYYALPAFDAPGSQITITDASGVALGTQCVPLSTTHVKVTGGAFGPPGACLVGDPPTSCPLTNTPGTASRLTVAGLTSPFAPAKWSDTAIETANVTSGTLYGCNVTVATPYGSFTTDDEVTLCNDQWRPWTPSGVAGRTHGASSVQNDFMIYFGGRSSTAVTSGQVNIQATPVPRCSSARPGNFGVPASGAIPGATTGRWGQAYTTASDGLYVIGGSNAAGTGCLNGVLRIAYSGGANATVTSRTALPDTDTQTAGVQGLCQGTAVTLFDTTDGNEYIVVSGGTTVRPNPSASAAVNALADITFVYNVATDTWTDFDGFGIARYNASGAGFRDLTTAGNNKALIVGGATQASNASAPAVSTTRVITLTNGVPSISPGPALPAARSLAGVAVRSGVFYVHGGATTVDTTASGTATLFAVTAAPLGAFSTLASSATGRVGHLFALTAFDEPTSSDLLRVVGEWGFGAAANLTNAEEYNP